MLVLALRNGVNSGWMLVLALRNGVNSGWMLVLTLPNGVGMLSPCPCPAFPFILRVFPLFGFQNLSDFQKVNRARLSVCLSFRGLPFLRNQSSVDYRNTKTLHTGEGKKTQQKWVAVLWFFAQGKQPEFPVHCIGTKRLCSLT